MLSVRKYIDASGLYLLAVKGRRASVAALGAVALGTALCAHATVLTPPVHVTKFHIFTDYGNGDVAFNVDATVAGCYGFWLSPGDPGFNQAYAALLAAKASGMSMVVYADDTQLWTGSTDKYCRVRSLSPE